MTELIWEKKYKNGKKVTVANYPSQCGLRERRPFQDLFEATDKKLKPRLVLN
jgi:hypothetical protein